MNYLEVHVDGLYSGNEQKDVSTRGSLGAYVISIMKETEKTFPLPNAISNHEAKYGALIKFLTDLKLEGKSRVVIYLNSELVVDQLNDEQVVESARLKKLHCDAKRLIGRYTGKGDSFVIKYIPKEENKASRLLKK